MSDTLLTKYSAMLSKYHGEKLNAHSLKTNIPLSRLICIAIDNELGREKPFEFDTTLPNEEIEDHAYADEGGRILKFLKMVQAGLSLDVLVLLRHDMGIPDKHIFLLTFGDLLRLGLVEKHAMSKTFMGKTRMWVGYRVVGTKDKKPK
jgi:hypothetical protein